MNGKILMNMKKMFLIKMDILMSPINFSILVRMMKIYLKWSNKKDKIISKSKGKLNQRMLKLKLKIYQILFFKNYKMLNNKMYKDNKLIKHLKTLKKMEKFPQI